MGTFRNLAIVLAVFLCACAGHSARPVLDRAPQAPGGLPALGDVAARGTELPRITSATHNFAASDIIATQNASFSGTTLSLDRDTFSYAILGANVGNQMPTTLTLSGTCAGLWVGVSDYSKGTWHWIGEDLDAPLVLNLGGGTLTSLGAVYFALVCPEGSEAALDLILQNAGGSVDGTWNFMVWIAGDNNLAEAACSDLQELESVGSSANINILAGYDIDPAQAGGESGIDEVHFIKVVQDSDPMVIKVDGDPANRSFARTGYDSADPAHIAEFVDWAETNFPADHTALVLWDHGDGWLVGTGGGGLVPAGFRRPSAAGARQISGVLGDDTDGSGGMTPNSAIADALAGKHFDLLMFDACNMAHLEALYEYRGLADWLAASEVLVPNDGYPYADALNAWQAAFPLAAEDVGKAFVDANTAHYSGTSEYVTHAVVSTAEMSGLAGALTDLAADVTPNAATEKDLFQQAMNAAFEPDSGDGERDLLGFLQAYHGLTANPEILADLDAAITEAQNAVYAFGQFDQPDATGISAWLPSSWYFDQYYQDEYDQLAFDDTTGWLAMLKALFPTPVEPVVVTTKWEPGDKLVVWWDDPPGPDLVLDPMFTTPDWRTGWPGNPDEVVDTLAFSDDSTVSNVCEEWCELQTGAGPGMYTYDLSLDMGAPVGSLVVYSELRASDGTPKYTFEPVTIAPGYDFVVAQLFYNDGSYPEADWVPGDKVEITWDFNNADFDLDITDPEGTFGSPFEPDLLAGIIEFSPDNYDSGNPLESGKLLVDGAGGDYIIEVSYWGYEDPPPPALTVSVKLYDSTDTLKQDLGTINVDPVNDQYKSFPAAILTYNKP